MASRRLIDFDDVGQMTTGEAGTRIPIDTPEKFAAVSRACEQAYAFTGREYDTDAHNDTVQRVLNGRRFEEVVAEAARDRRKRFNEPKEPGDNW